MTAAVEVRRREPLPVTVDQITLWETQAARLATSDMVKGGYRNKPDNIIAAAMIGAELGWSLMFSLQNIHSWTSTVRRKVWDPDTRQDQWISEEEPTTAISAQAQLSLLTEAGHSYSVEHYSASEIAVVGERCDRVCGCPERCMAHFVLTVRRDDPDLAHLAGRGVKGDDDYLPGRKMWRDHPRRMLWWATVRELVATMCPEVTMGMTASPDDAPTYEPPDAPVVAASLDRVAGRPTTQAIEAGATDIASDGDGAVEVSEGPEPVAPLAGSGPAPPGSAPRSPKARAKDAVLAGCGGDVELAAECWDEMVSKAPWLKYTDPEGWARAWLSARKQPLADGDTTEEPAASEWCDYRGRDGRRCVRMRHDSKNHTLEPKPQDTEISEGSGDTDQQLTTGGSRPGAESSDPSDTFDGWDVEPPGQEPFEPPLGAT